MAAKANFGRNGKEQNNGTTARIRPDQAPGATWNRSRRFAYCDYAHVRTDLHQWPTLEEALITFLGEALSRYEALRKRSGHSLLLIGRSHRQSNRGCLGACIGNQAIPVALLIVAHGFTPAFPQAPSPGVDQPKVNAKASTPASRNSISNWRSAMCPGCRIN